MQADLLHSAFAASSAEWGHQGHCNGLEAAVPPLVCSACQPWSAGRLPPSLVDPQTNPRASRRPKQPNLSFSERSTVYQYDGPAAADVPSKSSARKDRKRATRAALSEAVRIRRLLQAAPCKSTTESLHYLLERRVILIEETVGIEPLLAGRSPRRVAEERRAHVRAVVAAQHAHNDDCIERLGRFAAARSAKAVQRARIRAAVAA